jgi:hypothetical protein
MACSLAFRNKQPRAWHLETNSLSFGIEMPLPLNSRLNFRVGGFNMKTF